MSWYASGFVKAITVSSTGNPITRGEKLILLILADYHNSERNYADPSINRLAEEGLYERRQVMRIVESLEEKSFIRTEKEANLNTKYFILGLPEEVVTKCHPRSRKVVTFHDDDGDIGGDISPSKMSPEPLRTIEPIKITNNTPPLFELNPSELKDPISPIQKEKQAKEKLPDWLPMEQWLGYVDMRKKSKHPLTDYAQKLELRELIRLRGEGHDPVSVLEQSIRKSYRGLFAPNGINGNGHQPPPEDALARERRREAERRKV